MAALLQLRQAGRSVARRPGTALALLLTIALGIGSNAAVFAFTTGLFSRKQPVISRGQEVVSILSQDADGLGLLTFPEYQEVGANREVFELVAAARETVSTVRAGTTTPFVTVAAVTREAAELFGLPSVSSGVVAGETAPSNILPPRRDGLNEPITVDGVPYPIVGTAPEWLEGLYFGRPVALWRIVADPFELGRHSSGPSLSVLARLRPGVSLGDAQRALDARQNGGRALLATAYTGFPPEASTALRRLSVLLTAAALAVFLIACANVAVFLLSRATSLSHDTSIKVALGAGRGVLARDVAVESSLVLVPGAVMGVLGGLWTADLIPSLLFVEDAEQMVFAPDPAVVILAVAASVTITLCCGMAPMLETRHDQPARVLRRQATRSPALQRLQSGLVVLQMALCCTLVVSALLLFQSFRSSLRTASGEHLGHTMLATVQAAAGFDRRDLGEEYFERIATSIAAIPDVSMVAWAARLPGALPSWWAVDIERPDAAAVDLTATLTPFTPESLAEVILPPRSGRMFGGGDTRATCRVVVLNTAAAAAFDDRAPGRVLELPGGRLEVIGVVDSKPKTESARAVVYFYPEQGPPGAIGPPIRFRGRLPVRQRAVLHTNVVSSAYFEIAGLSLRDGRLFREGEAGDACRVGVLNRQAADTYFDGKAVGGALIDPSGERTTIIGVVDERPVRATQRRIEPTVYLPATQDYQRRMTLLATARPGALSEDSVERRLTPISGGVVVSVSSFDTFLRKTALASERIGALLVGVAAVNALVLGVLGLYRAIADEVLRRQQEIAVRVALGASSGRMIRLLLARAGAWTVQGAAIGLAGALTVRRWLPGAPEEPLAGWAWVLGPAILLVGAFLASVTPIRRMLRVDPLGVMRS